MLFQPTNITPDVLGGAENSTANVSVGLTISWQVNGTSPMVAYRIGILANDASSTSLYNTGIVRSPNVGIPGTDPINYNLPIYPTNYKGEPQRISHTIDAATLSANGITNGSDYKIAIRQWWGAEDPLDNTKSIRNMNYPLFHARGAAHVAITSPTSGSVIATYNKTFIGSYWQGNAQSLSDDPIEWVQWRIYDSADRGRTIYDSQKIYTQELKLDYDGFLNGRTYVVDLTIRNAVGQTANTTESYDVSWTTQLSKGVAEATRLNNQSSAVKVSWTGIDYIPAVITNYAVVMNSTAVLDANCGITYNEMNGSPLALATPWALAMHTTIKPSASNPTVNILNVTMPNNKHHTLTYNRSTRAFVATGSNGSSWTADMYSDLTDGAELKIYIDSSFIKVYKMEYYDELYPSDTLYPSNTLFPTQTDNQRATLIANVSITGTQGVINSIAMEGMQDVDFIEVVSNVTSDQKTNMIDHWVSVFSNDALEEIKAYDNISLFADYDTSLDAGDYSIGGERVYGWEVYRKRKSEAFARHLCSLELDQMSFIDYGCASQQGKYTYFIYPRSLTGTYITSGMQSNTIQPVFWNWSIVEATYNKDNDQYNVVNEYIFRNNVSSGNISNNNAPGVTNNFTQYPTVQMSNVNYQSGTLTGLIGQVGYTSYVVQYGNSLVDLSERFKIPEQQILDDNNLSTWENHGYAGKVIKLFIQKGITEYFDDKDQRDAIWKLSTTTNRLFLKSRKGDVIEIRISSAISMTTMDNTPQQAINASIPWVQIDDAQDKHIVC